MSTNALRNHIPLGAPATREPCDGTETPLRVSLGFTPRWYRARLDIDFGETWHTDPQYRYESLLRMKSLLHDEFPSIPYFVPQFRQDGIEPTCATISGVYGIMLVPSLFGTGIRYFEDNWPDRLLETHTPKSELAALEPIDFDSHPVTRALFAQMDFIESKWGAIHGYLNYQGILNIAVKVRGPEIFIDIIEDPDFASRFFARIAETIGSISKAVQKRQRNSGFHIDLLSLSNCVMNMVSPDQYQKFVLPLDTSLSKEYARFGIHTCAWDTTPFLEKLRTIDRMGYLDTGVTADLARLRRLFPETRRAVMLGPIDLTDATEEQITQKIERVASDLAPCDIVIADIDAGIETERVKRILSIISDIESRLV